MVYLLKYQTDLTFLLRKFYSRGCCRNRVVTGAAVSGSSLIEFETEEDTTSGSPQLALSQLQSVKINIAAGFPP